MRSFLAACLLLLLAGCGDKAKDLYDTAQLEEKQNSQPYATKLLPADRRMASSIS
jgi:hypothetical protein